MGFEQAARAGISICMDDMVIPKSKKEILDASQAEVETVIEQYQDGVDLKLTSFSREFGLDVGC
jgi:DNA-directed RNA polymerase subunit beta'